MKKLLVCLLVSLLVFTPSFFNSAIASDGINLTVTRGPGAHDVTLSWTGGSPSYRVYRSTAAPILAQPANQIGQTAGTTFANLAFPENMIYFQVSGAPGGGPPVIASISPSGRSFGDLILISGLGFGHDPNAITVRFTYTEEGETLVVDQRVFWTTDVLMSLSVPMAVPDRVNSVEVIVGASTSSAVGYYVGLLPDDPTPGISGNETTAYLDQLDELVERFNARLDAWFVGTGTASQASVDEVHAAMGQVQGRLAALRASVTAQPAEDLAVSDVFFGTEAFGVLLTTLQNAVNALDGSPPGTVLCEGADARDQVLEVLRVIGVITDIIDTAIDVLNTACSIAIIATIFTLGGASPLAAAICDLATFGNNIIRPILDVIERTSTIIYGIANAAPKDYIPDTYQVETSHQLWGLDPPVVYVNGSIPVEFEAYSDFHNQNCFPSGCALDLSVSLFGVNIPLIFNVPYNTAPHQLLRCILSNPPGSSPFQIQPPVNDGATCRMTGNDIGGAWDKGIQGINIRSQCGSGTTLGPVQRTFRLVSGPRLNVAADPNDPGVTPVAAQLGGVIQLNGQFMPPFVSGSTTKAEALFGDATAPMISGTVADHYLLRVPDTTNAAGTVGLRVQGRDADRILPFDVLPPVLTGFAPAAPFPTEVVVVQATGMAADPNNNALTFNSNSVPVLSVSGNGVSFRVPANATGGELVQLTAMGVHVSNTLGMPVAAWADSTRLSHPGRSALHPAMAVDANGVVGVAWMDTHTDGGETRLVFTDVAPGDASFRDPIEITDEVVGYWANPQEPDVAVGPNGLFHVVWVNDAGELTTVAFAKGDTPSPSSHVTVASPDGVFRDPTIAVMPNGDVHIVAVDVPTDAAPYNIIVQFRSTDGGATWEPGIDLHGPAQAPPGQRDSFHVGDPELFAGPGGLTLAYTKGCFLDCDTLPGTTIVGRGAFTSGSVDGVNWSAPRMVSPRTSLNGGDLFHPMFPTVSNAVMQRHPVVVGDPNSAIAAWEAPTYGTHASGKKYATLKVSANREPYDPNAVSVITPTSGGYQNDYGWPTLAYVPGAPAQTSIAWVERTPGTSPDRVEGVPRIEFNRSTDGLSTFNIATSLTPTVDPGDTTTLDDEPSLAVDGTGGLHLVWLEGPEKNKVVRYTSTGTAYADTVATDPGEDLSFRNALFIDLVNSSTESIGLIGYGGTIVYWPGRPLETRWIGTGVDMNLHPNHDVPTVAGGFNMFSYGTHDFFGPMLTALDGRPHLFASDNPAAGDVMSELIDPVHTGDIVVAGRPLPGNQVEIVVSDPNTNHFTSVTPPFTKVGSLHIGVSPGDQYAVYQDGSVPGGEIVIVELSTGTEVQRQPGRNPVWWPVDDGSGVFWVGYVVERAIPGPDVEHVVAELATDGSYDEWMVTQPGGFVGRVAYSPDGGEIVWDCLLCGDAAADVDGASTIWLGNAGVTSRGIRA